MSKRSSPARVLLSDFKAKKEEEGAVDIDCGDGKVFRIPPPVLWSDEQLSAARSAQADPIGAYRSIFPWYDEFVAAGGSAAILDAVIQEQAGVSTGE